LTVTSFFLIYYKNQQQKKTISYNNVEIQKISVCLLEMIQTILKSSNQWTAGHLNQYSFDMDILLEETFLLIKYPYQMINKKMNFHMFLSVELISLEKLVPDL
jgi:hypothetical protein